MEDWFSDDERARLAQAGRLRRPDEESVPLARLFQLDGPGIWLVAEIDPIDTDLAYGLVDIGVGAPEIGVFSLSNSRAQG